MVRPAEKLQGLTLNGDWTVLKMYEPGPDASGMNFSRCYEVIDSDGKKAFLKALDFSSALRAPKLVDAVNSMTNAYIFERDLLRECRDKKMSRVVRAIDDGDVAVDDSAVGRVPYLIFEKADRDVRSQLNFMENLDLAWVLRSLHHMATGLQQLHGANIAHQDLKPSNALVFNDEVTKITDLGASSRLGIESPRDEKPVAGDPAYSPPELLYGYGDPDWRRRRFGADLYLLGSMISFFFANFGFTALLKEELIRPHRWGVWGGTFEEVLPYLHNAFSRVIVKVIQGVPVVSVAEDLEVACSQLCNPDPRERGVPRSIRGITPQYDMQRHISRFNYLARRIELGLTR